VKRFFRRIGWVLTALAAIALLAWAFYPAPIEVDAAPVQRGLLRVTVDQEGRTRVRERYVIASPVAGTMRRIELKAGDPVVAGQTVLAVIEPLPPALLDARSREELAARLRAAEAALRQSQTMIDRAEAELRYAQIEHRRIARLAESGAASSDELQTAALRVTVREAELRAARFGREVAQFQVEQARAAMLHADRAASPQPAAITIRSPVDGRVLRLIQESQTPVVAGQPLMEVGDPADLEVVVDVLSRDAVRIVPGAAVYFERWGGDVELRGAVRRIEPSGFTKISALGVEEQRVNVIVDLAMAPGQLALLGDGYRLDARIVVWERPDALCIPTGALLRRGEQWAAFVINAGRAQLRPLRIGQSNGLIAEVLEGVAEGETVILHPGDRISPEVLVRARQ
jgi:HlyD family secretion protein